MRLRIRYLVLKFIVLLLSIDARINAFSYCKNVIRRSSMIGSFFDILVFFYS